MKMFSIVSSGSDLGKQKKRRIPGIHEVKMLCQILLPKDLFIYFNFFFSFVKAWYNFYRLGLYDEVDFLPYQNPKKENDRDWDYLWLKKRSSIVIHLNKVEKQINKNWNGHHDLMMKGLARVC